MKEHRKAAVRPVLLGGMLLGLTLADIFTPDRLYSAYENRVLASRPALEWRELLTGSYMEDYEAYVTEQFVGRDNWIFIKTVTDLLIGKREINGVYLAKDGTLIEKHAPQDIDAGIIEKRLALIRKLTDWWEGRKESLSGNKGTLRIMLAPTADNVYSFKLPDYAPYYPQEELIRRVRETAGDNYVINIGDALNAHNTEYIYYRTDHHWTTLGAYYGYLEWAKNRGVTSVSYTVKRVSETFLGTLHSGTNLKVRPDAIDAYVPGLPEEAGIKVFYDFSEEPENSLYVDKYLETKNKYGYFLDDNHAFIRIEREMPAQEAEGKSLFVIKDSYANCLIPFLTEHYETIYVLDLRYYKGSLFPLLEQCDAGSGMDVLILYNVIHFIEEFQYY